MKTKIKPIGPLMGGLRLDVPGDLIADNEMTDCKNVRLENGLVKSRHGYVEMGGTLNGAVLAIDQFFRFSGTQYLLIVTSNEMYVWDSGDGIYTRLSLTVPSTAYGYSTYGSGVYGGISKHSYGGGYYGEGLYGTGASITGIDSDLINYAEIRPLTSSEPWWIVTNGVDVLKKFTGGITFETLGGFPPKAKNIVEFKSHLLLLDTTEGGNRYPQRIRWSDTGDPEEWDTGNANYIDLDGPDWIKGAVRFRGNYLAILKEDSLWVGYATGDSSIFQFDRKTFGEGCAAGHTIVNILDDVVFLGKDNVYAFNGIQAIPIGNDVRTEMFGTINDTEIERSFAFVLDDKKEYHLFVPAYGSTYPNIDWVYNYEYKKWTKYEFAHDITSTGFYTADDSLSFDDLTGSFNSWGGRFDDRTRAKDSPVLLFGDKDGNVYEYSPVTTTDNGTTIDSYFDTKDFNLTGLAKRQRINRKDVNFIGSGLDVYFSKNKGRQWNLMKSFSSNKDFARKQISYRIDGDWVRFRYRLNTSGGNFQFDRSNIYWQIGGRI